MTLKNIRKMVKAAIKDEKDIKLSKGALDYLLIKTEEFLTNISKNSIQFTRNNKRKTLYKEDVENCLDSFSLVLKNLPKR